MRLQENQVSTYKFKRRSNEEQHKTNRAVSQKIAVAKYELSKEDLNSSDLEKAVKALNEGKDILDARQKLILIADSSELGWRGVEEYTANEFADDSDDDRKILRANQRAERKSNKALSKKKNSFRAGP